MMRVTRVFAAAIFSLALAATANATTISLTVVGSADIWLAGMPAGSVASSVDTAPDQSPALVGGLSLSAGTTLRFAASGGVSNTPDCPCAGPDGGEVVTHFAGAENGISSVYAPLSSLLGVFLSDSAPNLGVAPGTLNFGVAGVGTNFSTLSPELQQVFFIGDGNSGLQDFIVPVGATRLFLGTMDGFEWGNNAGQFLVDVTLVENHIEVFDNTPAAVPEPTTMLLLGSGLLGVARMRKKI
jgi:hypothetical protein